MEFTNKELIAEFVRRHPMPPIVEPPHCDLCFEGCPICKPMADSGPSIAELRKMIEG